MEYNNSNLKSCPFCGEPAKLINTGERISNFIVRCQNSVCWVEPQTGSFDYQAEAENVWNTRFAADNE